MRTIIGYIDGKAVWTANVPSEAAVKAIRGSLVVGESADPKTIQRRDQARNDRKAAA
jgi:hypothetical protein